MERRKRHGLRRQPARRRRLSQAPTRPSAPDASLEFRGDPRRGVVPARRPHRRQLPRATCTRCSAPATRATRCERAPTSAAVRPASPSRASRRIRRISTGSIGTRARSATTSTGAWSPPTAGSFGPNLRPTVSDLNSGGAELALDWLRMSPYTASGTFDSRVFDAGQGADWGALTWSADTPGRHRCRAQRPHRRAPRRRTGAGARSPRSQPAATRSPATRATSSTGRRSGLTIRAGRRS